MPKKILLFEANDDIAAGVKVILQNAGYDVKIVDNPSECKVAASKVSYDMILLDLLTPEMYGYDLFEEMKAKSNSTFIFHSNVPLAPGIVRLFQKMGAKDHIVKPFSKPDLLYRIEDILSKI
jgi:DNA-binding response OmpR family regulator